MSINKVKNSSLVPFSTINGLSISVNNSDFTSIFLKTASQANPGLKEVFHVLIDEFLNISF